MNKTSRASINTQKEKETQGRGQQIKKFEKIVFHGF